MAPEAQRQAAAPQAGPQPEQQRQIERMYRAEDVDVAAALSDQRLHFETAMEPACRHRACANRTVIVPRHGSGLSLNRTRAQILCEPAKLGTIFA